MLAYYYHENSDCIFIEHRNKDFGSFEGQFVHKIGLCFRGNIPELKKRVRMRNRKGFVLSSLKSVEINLEKPYLPF